MLNNRNLQGFLSLAPFVLFFLVFIIYFVSIFSVIDQVGEVDPGQLPTGFFAGMGALFLTLLATFVISLLSLIYFIVHAVKNPNLEQGNMRIVWILIIVLVNGLGVLIYWIAEILAKNPKPVIR